MIKIQKATSEHFEAVFKLIQSIVSDRHNSKKDWGNLFVDHFTNEQTYFGYVLCDGEEVVGFLGLIFSKRNYFNREINFCNIGNWFVLPNYRNKSINLLFPVLKTEDCVLTNFTASPTVSKILKTLNFRELDEKFYIIPPLPNLTFFKLFNKKEGILYGHHIERYLRPDELKIFKDHSNSDFNCKHILFKDKKETCYIVAKKAFRKNIPFLHVHYISNARLFLKHLRYFKIIVPIKFKVFGIILDQRLLNGKSIRCAISYKLQSPRFYKQKLKIPIENLNTIDHLYSEFIVLNI